MLADLTEQQQDESQEVEVKVNAELAAGVFQYLQDNYAQTPLVEVFVTITAMADIIGKALEVEALKLND